jgi:hypothetical protein
MTRAAYAVVISWAIATLAAMLVVWMIIFLVG